MNVFWILLIVLSVAAVAGLVPALFRPPPAAAERARNRALHDIRLAELRRDVEDRVIAEADSTGARDEIARALLEETDTAAQPEDHSGSAARWSTAVIILCLVPTIAGLTYFNLGQPLLATRATPPHAAETAADRQAIDEMIRSLERRLVDDPASAEGWLLLGRTYMSLKRYDDAVPALARAHELVGDVPRILVQRADAIAMANGGRIGDEARALVTRALEIEPDNVTALWLAGLAAAETGEREQALDHLRRARILGARNGASTAELDAVIHGLEAASGTDATEVTASASIEVSIDIDPGLSTRIGAQDVLFVFARAPGQGGPPLAVARAAAGNLPLKVTLDDTMAMAPMFKLRGGETVAVTARISKSGTPGAQSGDLQGASEPFVVGDTADVKLMIDEIVE